MDEKELTMVIEAVKQLGESGESAFVWWLVMDKGLSFAACMVALVLLYRILTALIDAAKSGDAM